jgi:Uma2 family endonuclease
MTAVTATRFSIAEYHSLGELGFLGPDDRVELIGPEIIIKALKSTLHSVCNSLLVEELIILLARRARMGVQ